MKKIFYLASIAALAFSSCAKDQTTEATLGTVNGGSKIVAAMEADDTRTQLDAGVYKWSAGDQLGVYGIGTNTLNNAAFVLDNSAAGSAVGVFASQATELSADKTYLAVYPRLQKSIITQVNTVTVDDPTTSGNDKLKKIDASSVNVEILDVQKYQDGSFYTNTAPAISSNFVVSENGATVDMQPVVDYLFVNIKSVEPIKELTLTLRDGKLSTNDLVIAGKSTLSSYWYGNEYRYYAPAPTEGSMIIKLQTDEAYKSLTCHDPNTYVFVVPAGILGMGNDDLRAIVTVNDGVKTNWRLISYEETPDDKYTTTDGIYFTKDSDIVTSNYDLNFRWVDLNGNGKVDDKEHLTRDTKTTSGALAYRKENTIFWMNPVNPYTGERTSFMYNPNGDVVIEDQTDLLKYLEEYDAQNNAADAYICSETVFDFSDEALGKLATENEKNYEVAKNKYIDNYYTYGFPCVDKYNNQFTGSDAVITNVRALASENGIFGELGEDAVISGVTFQNIVAKTVVEDKGTKDEYSYLGTILASDATGAKAIDVTVDNPTATSVITTGDVAAFKGIEFVNIDENLGSIFGTMASEAGSDDTKDTVVDLTEVWDSIEGVAGNVFTVIAPEHRTIFNIDADDATYAKLTYCVDNNNEVASVVINNVSYWTGGAIKTTVKMSNLGDKGYYTKDNNAIQYAEELAYGGYNSAQLTRSMDMNWENLQWDTDGNGSVDKYTYWTAPEDITKIYGAGNTVSNIVMMAQGASETNWAKSSVAPFAITTSASSLVLDGVTINIDTDHSGTSAAGYVPAAISGLSNGLAKVDNVTINDLKVNAYATNGKNAPAANYYEKKGAVNNINFGYVAAKAENVKYTGVVVNGVESNVEAKSAMVAEVNITTEFDVTFTDSSVSGVSLTDKDMEQIETFADYPTVGRPGNISSDFVAHVWVTGENRGIKFNGVSNQPVFYIGGLLDETSCVVYYNNKYALTLTPESFDEDGYLE